MRADDVCGLARTNMCKCNVRSWWSDISTKEAPDRAFGGKHLRYCFERPCVIHVIGAAFFHSKNSQPYFAQVQVIFKLGVAAAYDRIDIWNPQKRKNADVLIKAVTWLFALMVLPISSANMYVYLSSSLSAFDSCPVYRTPMSLNCTTRS